MQGAALAAQSRSGAERVRAAPGGAAGQQRGRARHPRPVISRYTSFGSGSASGALLGEQMYSVYATLHQWDLNPYHWIADYLAACARNDGQSSADLGPWLPWRMDDARRAELSPDDMSPTVDRDGRSAKRPSETRPLG